MKIIITIEVDGENVTVSTETNESTKVIEQNEEEKEHNVSEYAQWFDDGCFGWEKNAEYNKMFLLQQQQYMNDRLRTQGHLFLNDVYNCLGMSKSKAGQVVGWFYDPECPDRYNFVDFGLTNERNADFMNGRCNTVLLDFNVHGNIIDMI